MSVNRNISEQFQNISTLLIESNLNKVNINSLNMLFIDLLNNNINLNHFLISYLMFGIFSIFFFFKLNVAPFHA